MEQEQLQLDFYAMLQESKKAEESKEKEESNPVEEVREEPKKVEEPKEKKKASTPKKNTAKKKEIKPSGYTYPFSLYTEGRVVDISNYGFEDDKTYSEKEITEIMLRHRHYEFSGEMTYSMIEEDNTLVATAKQYKKG